MGIEVIKGKKKVLLIEVDTGENTVTVSGSPYPPDQLEKLPLKEKGFTFDSWTGNWFYSYPATWKGSEVMDFVRAKIYEGLKAHAEAVTVLMKRGLFTDIIEVWSKE